MTSSPATNGPASECINIDGINKYFLSFLFIILLRTRLSSFSLIPQTYVARRTNNAYLISLCLLNACLCFANLFDIPPSSCKGSGGEGFYKYGGGGGSWKMPHCYAISSPGAGRMKKRRASTNEKGKKKKMEREKQTGIESTSLPRKNRGGGESLVRAELQRLQ